jgi:predicted RNA-binding protein with PUA-like domain
VRSWIFQANPKKYEIFTSLSTEKAERWNARQHVKEINIGDRVYIWICGPQAGIYGVGTILTLPAVMQDTPAGIRYWTDPADGRRPIARVDVRYDRIMLDRPLLKPYLRADPVLRNLSILRMWRGTNFPVEPNEARVIEEWLADTT